MDDRKLIEEVIFLHSLWHQGPPPPSLHHLDPFFFPHKIPKNNIEKKNKVVLKSQEILDSNPKWESNPTNFSYQTSDLSIWPSFDSQSGVDSSNPPPPPPPSADDIAISRAKTIQIEALKSCKNFLWRSTKNNDESEEEEEEEEDCKSERELFDFFLNLFVEDVDLRELYEERLEGGGGGGVFFCLVCDGRGRTMRRSYGDCVALVQHCASVKMKKREHVELVKVICKVLGWNFERLPTIVLSSEASLGRGLLLQA